MEFFRTNKEEEKKQLDDIAADAIGNASNIENAKTDMDMMHDLSQEQVIEEKKIIDIEKLFDKRIEELEDKILTVSGYAINNKNHDQLQDEIREAADTGSDDYAEVARKTALLASYKNQINYFETLNNIDPEQRKEIVEAYDHAVETLEELEAMIRVAKKNPSLN